MHWKQHPWTRWRRACAPGLIAAVCAGAAALADHAPAWVIPNPRGIPIVVDGLEVSGAVIEGDWGLYRPGHGSVTIYAPAHPLYLPPAAGFFPATGRRPRSGRLEVETPEQRRPRRAEAYSRSWSTGDVDESYAPYQQYQPPAAFEGTVWERRKRRPDRRRR